MSEQQDPTSSRGSSGVTERRLAALEDRLRDLADDQRRLHEQIRDLVDSVADLGHGRPPSPPAPAPVPPENTLPRRAARFALRSTLGLLKRLWRASDPARDWFIRVESDSAAADPASTAVDFATVGERTPGAVETELAQMVLASESLDFLAGPTTEGSDGVLWLHRDLGDPETGIDLRALTRRGRGRRPVIGKVLPGASVPNLPNMVRIGSYMVSKKHLPLRHRVRPIAARPSASTDGGGAPKVLIVLGAPLSGGLERLAADLVQGLGDDFELIFAASHVSDVLQTERLGLLAQAIPRVYPVADWLPAEVVPSALAFLAGSEGVAAVLHLGDQASRRILEESLSTLDRRPPILGAPTVSCGVVLPSAGREERAIRAELGIPSDAILVTIVSDLTSRQRPEDFVTLAHLFRDDSRFFFLLIGRGPLAGTVEDLERFLAPGNLRTLATADENAVLATTDIACTLGEDARFPFFIYSALAASVPVVATDVDAIGERLADGPCGVAVPVADLAACVEAILDLADVEKRRTLGRAGRQLTESSLSRDQVIAAYRRRITEAITETGTLGK